MKVQDVRKVIREMMPSIPLDQQEEVTQQVLETVARYGFLRAATVGEVVVKVLEREVSDA